MELQQVHDVGALSPITEMRDPTQRQSKAVGEKSNALSSGRRYFISGINPESKLFTISKVCSVFGDVAYIEKVISFFFFDLLAFYSKEIHKGI